MATRRNSQPAGALTVSLPFQLAPPLEGALRMTPHGYFGAPRPQRGGVHMGVDLVAPEGAPVASATLGKVVRVGFDPPVAEGGGGGGNFVIVSTGAYELGYMHLSSIGAKVGDQVQAGQTIGAAGATGTTEASAHLHFQVKQELSGAVRYIDPTDDLGLSTTAPTPSRSSGGGRILGLLALLLGAGWLWGER